MFLGQLASNFAPIKLVKTLVFGYPKLTTSLHKTLITFYECTHTHTARDRNEGRKRDRERMVGGGSEIDICKAASSGA